MPGLSWDLFCRVVDNFGDIGVCWRLACDLASRGERVRLWIDDDAALRWMAPAGCAGVEVVRWTEPAPDLTPGDVVVETFGCDPPTSFVARMAQRTPPPRWINLEYLSAEDYVERSHLLSSPQFGGPGAGLTKRFFYPGFTPATGGLIREPDLAARQATFDAPSWRAAHGIAVRPGERVVSLFCYPDAPLPALLRSLRDAPTLLLATAGAPADAIGRLLGQSADQRAVRMQALPWLDQRDYDHLLWSCDLNFVRGEDSFVRAQWAAKPFVWQAYRQQDALHLAKVEAFLARMLAGADAHLASALREVHLAWNGAGDADRPLALPDLADWRAACVAWRTRLWQQPDLATQLLGVVADTG